MFALTSVRDQLPWRKKKKKNEREIFHNLTVNKSNLLIFKAFNQTLSWKLFIPCFYYFIPPSVLNKNPLHPLIHHLLFKIYLSRMCLILIKIKCHETAERCVSEFLSKQSRGKITRERHSFTFPKRHFLLIYILLFFTPPFFSFSLSLLIE